MEAFIFQSAGIKIMTTGRWTFKAGNDFSGLRREMTTNIRRPTGNSILITGTGPRAKFSVSIDVFRGFTLTPVFGFRDDEYLLDPTREVGLTRDRSRTMGIEAGWLVDPNTRVLVSYMNEPRSQVITSAGRTSRRSP